jgi:hypothetical protein
MRFALAVLLLVAATAPSGAADEPKNSLKARDRINKVWDERLAKIRDNQIEAKCKADAKKQYAAIRFKKRRLFVQDCIEQAYR